MMSSSRAALLSSWDAAEDPWAPLSSSQLQTVADLASVAAHRPLPTPKSTAVEMAQSKHTSSSLGRKSCSTTTESSGGLHECFASLDSRPVVSSGQWMRLMHRVQKQLQRDEDKPILDALRGLQEQREALDDFEKRIMAHLELLDKLASDFAFVSTKSEALHNACESLVEEQKKLARISEEISAKLAHMADADAISQKLVVLNAGHVNSEAFIRTLDRIHEGYCFVLDHPEYKESSSFLVKYQACLSRALGHVRAHVRHVLDEATANAMEAHRILEETDAATKDPSMPSAFTILYGKFQASAPKVSLVLSALEKRSDPSSRLEEYATVLSDCQDLFFGCRRRLLQPSLESGLSELLKKHDRDYCSLARACCAFLLHICEDETQLYTHFFTRLDPEPLNDFLETLCQLLLHTLRPLVIQLQHLETLSELTTILRNEVLQQHCAHHPVQLIAFEKIVAQLLQDVQERLVHRASVYISNDILGYTPGKGDLAYPDNLMLMEAIASSLEAKNEESSQKGHQRQSSTSSTISTTSLEVDRINHPHRMVNASSPSDMHGMWYPSVRRTLLCLSRLYRSLELSVFTSLSEEALRACVTSLKDASARISEQRSKRDALLFEIKHLLILREQIAPFHMDNSLKEVTLDFSRMKNAAMSLLTTRRKHLLTLGSNNALLEFLLEGARPEVVEHLRDTRRELDLRLKETCEQFIAHTRHQLVGNMQDFVSKVEMLKRSKQQPSTLGSENWSKAESVHEVVMEMLKNLRYHLPNVNRAMHLYLANKETQFILFRPIRNAVMSVFVLFRGLVRERYDADAQLIIACPTQEHMAALIASLLMPSKTNESNNDPSKLINNKSVPENGSDLSPTPHAVNESKESGNSDQNMSNGTKEEEKMGLEPALN